MSSAWPLQRVPVTSEDLEKMSVAVSPTHALPRASWPCTTPIAHVSCGREAVRSSLSLAFFRRHGSAVHHGVAVEPAAFARPSGTESSVPTKRVELIVV